jgi:PAS domain S-box-containing protein
MSRQRIITTAVAAIAVVATFLWIPHARATTQGVGAGTHQYPPPVSVGAQEQPDAVPLTADEKAWLKDHPSLRLGVDPAWPPYEFFDQSGRYSGIAADYVKLIANRLGITMEVHPGLTWEQVLTKLKAKDLDVSPALTQTPERSQFLLFTQPFIKYSVAIVIRSDHAGIQGLAALAGRKVALVKSYAFTEIALKSQPDMIPIYVDTILEGLNKVSNGEAEAIVSDLPSLSYRIREYNFFNLKVAGVAPFQTEGLCIGVRNDWPVLVSILDKGLAAITPEEHQQIRHRWVTLLQEERVAIDLSPEEWQWLARHPVIKNMVDPDWAPIEFIDEQGRPSGITSEYLSRLEQILHVRFENPQGMTWAQMMDALKDGRLDMTSCFRDTPQRRQFMDFTDAYLSMPTAIFTRNDVSYVDLASLAGKPVAVVEGYAVQGFLAEGYPEIQLVTVRNLKEGLTLLSEGKVYAYIDALAPGSYGLTRYGFTNIRAAGETPFRYEMSMAASKQQPELASILEKAIKAVPEADRNRFYQKWSNVQISYKPDYAVIWKMLAGSAGLVLIFTYWTRRLSSEVSRRRLVEAQLRQAKEELELRVEERTAELEARNVALGEEVIERKRAEHSLWNLQNYLANIIDSMPSMLVSVDIEGTVTQWNQASERATGISAEDAQGKPLGDVLPALSDQLEGVKQALRDRSARSYSNVPLSFNDEIRYADITVYPLLSNGVDGAAIRVDDVTEPRRMEQQLKESEERFRSMIRNSSDLITVLTADGVSTYQSPALKRLLGYEPEDLTGVHVFAYIHPEDLPVAEMAFSSLIHQGGVSSPVQYRFRHADGTWVYMEAVGSNHLDDSAVRGVILNSRDITERRHAEEALKASEAFRKRVFDSSRVPMIVMDGETFRYIDCNPAAVEIYRFSTIEETIGKTPLEVSTAVQYDGTPSVEKARFYVKKALAEGMVVFEWRHQCPDGEIWDAEVHLMSFQAGERQFLQFTLQDITDRKRAIEALRASEKQYRSVIENIQDVFYRSDAQGRLLMGSPSGAKMFGYDSVDEMVGLPLDSFWPDPMERQQLLAQIKATGSAKDFEAVLRKKDGTRFCASLTTHFYYDDDGNLLGTEGILRDVTERKKAAETLRENEERLRLAITAANQGLFDLNVQTGETTVSPEYATMLGYDPATFHETNAALTERLHPDDRKRVFVAYRDYLAGKVPNYQVEFRQRTAGGSWKWILSLGKIAEYDAAGQPVRMLGTHTDITERKQAEENLAESIRRLRTVVDGAPIVLYSFDRHGVFTLSEGKGLVGLGIKPGEIVGKTIFEVYGDQTASIAALRRALAGESFTLELSFSAGGTFEVSHMAMHDEAGNYNGTIGVLVDITERKRAEEALRESELRYRLLFSSINDAVFVHGLGSDGSQGPLIEVNEVACKRLGYTREELLQMSPQDLDAPEMRDLVPSILKRLSVEGHAVWEGAHVSKAGRRIPVEISNRMFELGEETVVLSTVRDISERRAAEDENRRLRNYLANIIDSMPSVLVGVDMNGRVTQWNAAAQQRTGISAEGANGQSVDLVLPALSGELDKVKEAVRSRMVTIENRVPQMADGEMRYQDVTVYPLVSNGLEGAVIRVDDVTERVQIEEMMIQSEKMLSVGGLAAGMAHEINNPLGAILQASQNIVRRVSPELPVNLRIAEACGTTLDTVRKYLEQREILSFLEDIRNSGLRAAQIVENVLAFSRKPEAGGSSTDLAELLDRTLLLAGSDYDLKKRYDFRQIEIIRDYAPDTPPVICQAGKMQQVFLNILRNGAEAMREVLDSGRVPRFILRILPEESMVRVEIEDNGPGMDEVTRKRIFEPFFTTKPPGSGTGLGLSISYFIVTEDHGGTLSVDSQPGIGTRFVVRLPIAGRE